MKKKYQIIIGLLILLAIIAIIVFPLVYKEKFTTSEGKIIYLNDDLDKLEETVNLEVRGEGNQKYYQITG
jgi:uncharacterized protein YpmB